MKTGESITITENGKEYGAIITSIENAQAYAWELDAFFTFAADAKEERSAEVGTFVMRPWSEIKAELKAKHEQARLDAPDYYATRKEFYGCQLVNGNGRVGTEDSYFAYTPENTKKYFTAIVEQIENAEGALCLVGNQISASYGISGWYSAREKMAGQESEVFDIHYCVTIGEFK